MADTRRVNIIRDNQTFAKPVSDRYQAIGTLPPSAHIPAIQVLQIEMQRLSAPHRLAIMTQYCQACGAHKTNEICRCYEA